MSYKVEDRSEYIICHADKFNKIFRLYMGLSFAAGSVVTTAGWAVFFLVR